MSEYVTAGGLRLEISRIPRQVIDDFLAGEMPPEPPIREVEAWGGITEEVPVLDDPGYLAAMQQYYLQLGDGQIDLIAPAVGLPPDCGAVELEELRALGLAEEGDGKADLLRYVVLANEEDLGNVTELVFYNSTVTERGIAEAKARFGVTWHKLPVAAWHVPSSPAGYNLEFEARRVGREAGYKWGEFCKLSGPEQSAEVALQRLGSRLAWLESQRQR